MLQMAENSGVLKADPLSPRYHYFISRQTVVLRESRRFWSRARYAACATCPDLSKHESKMREYVSRLALYNFMVMNARPPACRSLVIPKEERIEYHSALTIKKPMPGDNPISRFINRQS
jgi:hypothetical protein